MVASTAGENRKFVAQAAVSIVLAAAGFAVLLFHLGNDPSLSKLAAGWLGAVIGYWLQ